MFYRVGDKMDGGKWESYNITFLNKVPKSWKVNSLKVPANWIEKVSKLYEDRVKEQPSYAISYANSLSISKCGVIPELNLLLEKYRKEYEEFKKTVKL